MHAVTQQMNKLLKPCLVCLLLTALLCGCGFVPTPANTAQDPNPSPTPNAEPEQTPDPEELAREQRLSDAKDSFLWDDGFLQAIDDEGDLLTDRYIGVLHFGLDSKYTSGSRELDELVAKVVNDYTESDMTRMEMLRAMYDYTIGNLRYVGQSNYNYSYLPAHGKDGWMPEAAIKALKNGYGNCYSFAAVFAALARGIGYQAYATGGQVGATEDPHGWVQILDDDGNMWMNDPEIEYRFGNYYQSVLSKETPPDLFYKSPDMIGAETGMSYRALRDPYEAEEKEAQQRQLGMIPIPVTPEPTNALSSGVSGNSDQSVTTAEGTDSSDGTTASADKPELSVKDIETDSKPETGNSTLVDNTDQTPSKCFNKHKKLPCIMSDAREFLVCK